MRAPNLWSHTVLLALSTVVFLSDAAAERIAATYCVTIGVTLEGTSALVKRLDDFALDSSLTFEVGDPGGRYYFPRDESAIIALRNGMGEFGSVLSYVPLGTVAEAGLPDRLEQFVQNEIVPVYETTPCQDIEGFSMPEIRR